MTAARISVRRIGINRRLLAVTLLALAACGHSADKLASSTTQEVSVSGLLTLKGAQPGAWWSVTDDQGQVWKIISPTPQQADELQQAQNRRVSVAGRREGKYLNFEQVRLFRITVMP